MPSMSFFQSHEQTIKSFASVALWSIFGAWTRLAINKLISFDSDPIQSIFVIPFDGSLEDVQSITYSDFWPNVAGSFTIGILVEQAWLKQNYPTMYFGMTSGFCGSLTTFSSWMIQAFLNAFRGEWHNFVLILLTGISSSLFSLSIGIHLGQAILSTISSSNNSVELPTLPNASQNNTPNEPNQVLKPEPPTVIIVIGTLCFLLEILVMLLIIFYHKGTSGWAWWVALFAPFGALTRFLLSQHNKNFERFPLFTFLVNMSGTVLLGLIFVYRSLRDDFGSESLEGAIFYGLSSGFCGCLTTVSTFVVELTKMKTLKDAYVYGIASIAVTQVLLLLSCGIFLFVKY